MGVPISRDRDLHRFNNLDGDKHSQYNWHASTSQSFARFYELWPDLGWNGIQPCPLETQNINSLWNRMMFVSSSMTAPFESSCPGRLFVNSVELYFLYLNTQNRIVGLNGGHYRGGTPYNGLYGEVPPERGTFFRLEVYKRVGISRAQV